MKRVLISLGLGFLVGLVGYLSQTVPVYLDFLAHQPGRVPVSETDAFSPWLAFTFGFGSPLWIPLGFATAALIWTVWTLWKDGRTDPKFPVRLLIVYLLCLSALPTLVVMGDFGDLEATEEDWNWVLGWSFLLIGPVLAALYLAVRNFRLMPLLSVFTAFFALFHITSTIGDYGFYPRYGWEEPGAYDLQILNFLNGPAAILAVPFLVIYLIWKFWPHLKLSFLRRRTVVPAGKG